MSTGPDTPQASEPPSSHEDFPPPRTAWVGWIAFAAMMLMLVGGFHFIQGLVALFNDEYYAVSKEGLLVSVDFTTWGWVHLVGGVVLMATGGGLLAGQLWARVVGVVVAMLSALVNVGFLGAYPIWSALMITIDILIIWAITVHGREMKAEAMGSYEIGERTRHYQDEFYTRPRV